MGNENQVAIELIGEDDKLKSALQDAHGALEHFAGGSEVATSAMQKLHFGFDLLSKGASLAKEAVKDLANWLFEAGKKAIEKEESWLRFNAVVKANAGASEVTRAQLDLLASAMLDFNQATEGATKEAEIMLLTFQNVKGENFIRTIKVAADLSAVMGGDLASATFMLGRALENPAEGFMSLGRAGIKFTEAQKEIIKQLLDGNQAMEAQSTILDIIESKIGGVAKEMDGTAKDAFEEMQNQINKVQVSLGKEFLPILKELGPTFTLVAEYATAAGKAMASVFHAQAEGAVSGVGSMNKLLGQMDVFVDGMQIIQIVAKGLYMGIVTIFAGLTESYALISKGLAKTAYITGAINEATLKSTVAGINGFRDNIREQWQEAGKSLDGSLKAEWWSKSIKKAMITAVKPSEAQVDDLFKPMLDESLRQAARDLAESEADFDNLLKQSKKVKDDKEKTEKQDKDDKEKSKKDSNKDSSHEGEFVGLEELHKRISAEAGKVRAAQADMVNATGNGTIKIEGFKNNPFNQFDKEREANEAHRARDAKEQTTKMLVALNNIARNTATKRAY